MTVLPAGSFPMGAPPDERGRSKDEGPVRTVRIEAPFAIGVYEVSVAEFRFVVEREGILTEDSCWTLEQGEYRERRGRSWSDPGYSQTDDHPVTCVNWWHALAYANWLAWYTGREYRLPSEAEWEYAARAGTGNARFWGDGEAAPCLFANGADARTRYAWRSDCDDGHAHAAPRGSYRPNAWGLHDMIGNALEWTGDCWTGRFSRVPEDVSATFASRCPTRILRGGSWDARPRRLRAAERIWFSTGHLTQVNGFRVVAGAAHWADAADQETKRQ